MERTNSDVEHAIGSILGLNAKDWCYSCQARPGKDKLRQCAGCKIVRYCSKECQRKAWPMHKKSCQMSTDRDAQMPYTPAIESELTVINKWLQYWRQTIFEYGIYAMDLANEPHDFLANHILLLDVEFRDSPKDKSRAIKMHDGAVLTRDQYVGLMRKHSSLPESSVQAWIADNRGPEMLQIMMVCSFTHTRTLWVSVPGIELLRRGDKGTSRLRAMTWKDGLRRALDTGKPSSGLVAA